MTKDEDPKLAHDEVEDIAPPRSRAAAQEGAPAAAGFTQVWPSGSADGRATHGLAPDEPADASLAPSHADSAPVGRQGRAADGGPRHAGRVARSRDDLPPRAGAEPKQRRTRVSEATWEQNNERVDTAQGLAEGEPPVE